MINCYVTENYLKEKDRMCNSFEHCADCFAFKPYHDCLLNSKTKGYSHEKAITIVQQWSDEHPRKTIMDDFLEKYPNAEEHPNYGKDAPPVCAKSLGYVKDCCYDTEGYPRCYECWQTPLNEVTNGNE